MLSFAFEEFEVRDLLSALLCPLHTMQALQSINHYPGTTTPGTRTTATSNKRKGMDMLNNATGSVLVRRPSGSCSLDQNGLLEASKVERFPAGNEQTCAVASHGVGPHIWKCFSSRLVRLPPPPPAGMSRHVPCAAARGFGNVAIHGM